MMDDVMMMPYPGVLEYNGGDWWMDDGLWKYRCDDGGGGVSTYWRDDDDDEVDRWVSAVMISTVTIPLINCWFEIKLKLLDIGWFEYVLLLYLS